MNPARDLAITLLQRIEGRDEFSQNLILQEEKGLADARDRALLRRLIYGVLQNRLLLDVWINRVSRKKIEKQKNVLRQLMRIAVYDLLFLNTPDHAGVNEAVELAKKRAPFARAYVNGALRQLLREKEDLAEEMRSQPLSIRSSHPQWMIEELERVFPSQQVEELLRRNNEVPPISLLCRPDLDRDEAVRSLREEGILSVRKSSLSPYSLLCQGGSITRSRLFQEGLITIQSQGSTEIARKSLLGRDWRGKRILDLCASPGSKTTAFSWLAPEADIVSNDKSPDKMIRLEENRRRLHLQNVSLSIQDACMENKEWLAAFDLVLVDAPCSGLGLLGRKPDIRYHRKKEDLWELAGLQRKILSQALRYVKVGGRLTYSTCSYSFTENESVIQSLLKDGNLLISEADANCFHRLSPFDEFSDGFSFLLLERGDEAFFARK